MSGNRLVGRPEMLDLDTVVIRGEGTYFTFRVCRGGVIRMATFSGPRISRQIYGKVVSRAHAVLKMRARQVASLERLAS